MPDRLRVVPLQLHVYVLVVFTFGLLFIPLYASVHPTAAVIPVADGGVGVVGAGTTGAAAPRSDPPHAARPHAARPPIRRKARGKARMGSGVRWGVGRGGVVHYTRASTTRAIRCTDAGHGAVLTAGRLRALIRAWR